jgi:hypothetical protein
MFHFNPKYYLVLLWSTFGKVIWSTFLKSSFSHVFFFTLLLRSWEHNSWFNSNRKHSLTLNWQGLAKRQQVNSDRMMWQYPCLYLWFLLGVFILVRMWASGQGNSLTVENLKYFRVVDVRVCQQKSDLRSTGFFSPFFFSSFIVV